MTIPKIKAPNGFFFKVRYVKYHSYDSNLDRRENRMFRGVDHISVTLHEKDSRRQIGYVHLVKTGKKNWFETHSSLLAQYWNRGFGVKLYGRAIQLCLENNYRVRSSMSPSADAERLWRSKSLSNLFIIKPRRNDISQAWYAFAKEQS